MDGPFAETKELVAGFWLWQVKSMEEAVEWLKRCPNPGPGEWVIEVRPVFETADFGDAADGVAAVDLIDVVRRAVSWHTHC